MQRRSWRLRDPRAIAPDVLVVDTSALLEALVAREPAPRLVERLSDDGDLHAPHLVDIEVLHSLRRLNAVGELSDERAADAVADFRDLALVRYPHVSLCERIWELRHNLAAYDAAFVTLAELLRAPLVTCDRRVSAAPGHFVEVELYGGQ